MKNIINGDSTEVMNDLDRIYRISNGLWLQAYVNTKDLPKDNEEFKFSITDKYHLIKGMVRFCMQGEHNKEYLKTIKKAVKSAMQE